RKRSGRSGRRRLACPNEAVTPLHSPSAHNTLLAMATSRLTSTAVAVIGNCSLVVGRYLRRQEDFAPRPRRLEIYQTSHLTHRLCTNKQIPHSVRVACRPFAMEPRSSGEAHPIVQRMPSFPP